MLSDSGQRGEARAQRSWIDWWLALLPVAYVLSPLALLGVGHLRTLPPLARAVLGGYLVTQLVPALLGPEPALNVVLALLRSALICGLLGVGVRLGTPSRLWPLGLGLLVVYATAVIFTLLGGSPVVGVRLAHPIMTPITLGLAGTFGLWLAVFLPGRLGWRFVLGGAGVAVLLLSGSRGPLAAALVGTLCGLAVRGLAVRGAGRWRGSWPVLAALALALGGLAVVGQAAPGIAAQLSRTDVTGRDAIWLNTLSVIQHEPWSGVGPYRLGQFLAAPGRSCELFADAQGTAPECPEWLERLGSPWLIAHNLTLHSLAESGPLGTLGLALLLGGVLAAAVRRREPFALAVLTGYLVMSINDNVLIVPSAGVAELFWITAGLCLRDMAGSPRRVAVFGTLTLLLVSQPVLSLLLPRAAPPAPAFELLVAPNTVRTPDAYVALLRPTLPAGRYRAVLRSCVETCATVTFTPFTVAAAGPALTVRLQGRVRDRPVQRLELLLYPQAVGGVIRPLAGMAWEVKLQP